MPGDPEAFTVQHTPLEYGDQFVVGADGGEPNDAVTIKMHNRGDIATVATVVPNPADLHLGGEVIFSPRIDDVERRQEVATALAGALFTIQEIATRTN